MNLRPETRELQSRGVLEIGGLAGYYAEYQSYPQV